MRTETKCYLDSFSFILCRFAVVLTNEMVDNYHLNNMIKIQTIYPDGNWTVEIVRRSESSVVLIIPTEMRLSGKETRKIVKQYKIDNIQSELFKNNTIYRITKKEKIYEVTEYEYPCQEKIHE